MRDRLLRQQISIVGARVPKLQMLMEKSHGTALHAFVSSEMSEASLRLSEKFRVPVAKLRRQGRSRVHCCCCSIAEKLRRFLPIAPLLELLQHQPTSLSSFFYV